MLGENIELEKLVDYELRCAKRYGRYISIVMISPAGESAKQKEMVGGNRMRESDQVFDVEDGSIILMGETDKSGAIVALERYQVATSEEQDLRSAVVTFPFDGFTVSELLSTVFRRIDKAKKMSIKGAVITNG